jgi:hypothetical protein
MRDRLDKAQSKSSDKLTLRMDITGTPVMVDRIEQMRVPHTFIAKTQIERSIGILAKQLREKGEKETEVERVITKLVSNSDINLAFLCDFFDTASMYAERLQNPVEWIERIADHVAPQRISLSRSSLRAYQLFEEARSSQGTDREQILIKTLEGF